MATHVLKTWPQYFEAVARGEKTFEVRRDDRGFQNGDTLILKWFDPSISPNLQEHSQQLHFRIGWILTGGQFGIEPGYVVMALEPLPSKGEEE